MPLVTVGRIGRPHGLRGEVALNGCSLSADELHGVKSFTWRGRGEERALTLSAARPAHTRVLVQFEGVGDVETAATLTNGELLADTTKLPDAGPGQAYAFQMLGLSVVTEEGRVLGSLEDVIPTGAHSVYVVRGERELLLPAIPDVVRDVDLERRIVTVRLPAGIEDL